ncbi:hypothetical protein [Arsenophonus sp.]|uniref:hypothetical protein n=1 Tax=Arsenophonus sp. TaxID=1872640 RepID=UPI0028642B78|nr:hypothetical protein [Arsenophonus sp.]MDR5615687.1 hypothetical protein [Arsenophonus sp.]MDR5616273.1 hypothetical protein [Arsenophonus sp.]MDR5616868.1 hypothetical protein [Arsenophonus sp.]
MGHALKKAFRLSIPERNKSKIANPKPVISPNCSHTEQIDKAFDFGFVRYETTMKELSKV